MTNPIDALTAAIAYPDTVAPRNGYKESNADWTARVVRYVLTDDATIMHAAQALAADTASRPDSPLHAANMTVAEFGHLARVVLHSVGGG